MNEIEIEKLIDDKIKPTRNSCRFNQWNHRGAIYIWYYSRSMDS